MDTHLALVLPVTVAHLGDVMDLYAQAWWTRERSRERVADMLQGSQATVGFAQDPGGLVAFARAISDYNFKALIVDVIVDERYRNSGLGRRLVAELLRHPALSGVDEFELYCEGDLVAYYEQLGFTQPHGTFFMRLARS